MKLFFDTFFLGIAIVATWAYLLNYFNTKKEDALKSRINVGILFFAVIQWCIFYYRTH